MKYLTIIRHAHALAASAGIPDVQRPLDEQGITDARNMSESMKVNFGPPELILSSSAIRAVQTAEIIAKAFLIHTKIIQVDPDLYLAASHDFPDIIHTVKDGISELFLVGHNPAITTLAKTYWQNEIGSIPPAGAIRIAFSDGPWRRTNLYAGELICYKSPKQPLNE